MIKAVALIELEQLYAAKDFKALARHPGLHLKPEWAQELANNNNESVRRTLANNPALASLPDVATTLSDEAQGVRTTLAENAALAAFPENVVTKLMACGHVRRYLAGNPAIVAFPEIASRLASRKRSTRIRQSLANNPAIDKLPAVVEKLVSYPDWEVHRTLANNPALAAPVSPNLLDPGQTGP